MRWRNAGKKQCRQEKRRPGLLHGAAESIKRTPPTNRGRRRGLRIKPSALCRGEVRIFPSSRLRHRAMRALAKLKPPSRRRPPSITWPARLGLMSIHRRRRPARVTRSSSVFEDRQRLRLLLLPPLLRWFLRDFLSLLRHCCPPSLSGWRLSAVPSRIDGHYDRITTAGKKEQSLH